VPSFRNHPDDWSRLDYRLLQNGPVVLYRSREFLDEDLAGLEAAGYRADEVDCSRIAALAELVVQIGRALDMPLDETGMLDRFIDRLRDVGFEGVAGRVLILQSFDKYARHEPARAAKLLDTLARQARDSLLFGDRWIFLVQSGNPDLAFPKLGGYDAQWNPREAWGRTRYETGS
jgi:hypothetical protein